MKPIGPILHGIFVALTCTTIFLGTDGLRSGSLAREQQEIAGRYRFTGTEITHKINIPQQTPDAVIVVQYLPPNTEILDAIPAYNSYDATYGVAKWLFTKAQPGVLKIQIKLAQPVDSQHIRAEVLFKDHTGASNAYTIAPAPLRRKILEGC
ncbi:MAG: hypothetical protein PHI97_09575 [Desulfobulbus sp.]|nr:hypothetical protein [Desulfobulbus sp.]